MEKDFETLEEERQERLAEELDQRLTAVYQELDDILEIIDNEETCAGLNLELESIKEAVIRTLNSSVG